MLFMNFLDFIPPQRALLCKFYSVAKELSKDLPFASPSLYFFRKVKTLPYNFSGCFRKHILDTLFGH